MTTLMLKTEVVSGSSFYEAYSAAIRVATQLDVTVYFEFNQHAIYARPGDTVRQKCDEYDAGFIAKAEELRNKASTASLIMDREKRIAELEAQLAETKRLLKVEIETAKYNFDQAMRFSAQLETAQRKALVSERAEEYFAKGMSYFNSVMQAKKELNEL